MGDRPRNRGAHPDPASLSVLHVIDALGVGGGAEHSLADLLPQLASRGVRSSVVTLHPREGGLQARLRDEGYPVDVLAARRWPGRILELRRVIGRQQPDLVHASLFNAAMAARAACFGSPTPLLESLVNIPYDPHVMATSPTPRWKLETVRRFDGLAARRSTAHFHAVSGAVADHATSTMGIAADRLTVVRRGRDARRYVAPGPERRAQLRRALGLADHVTAFLNVGRQDRSKAQADLVRAFAALVADRPDDVLLIAGRPGAETGRIEQSIRDLDIGASVRLLGHRDDVSDLYAAADVFVLPSRFEGAAGSMIEAMAIGLPVIASDAPPLVEILEGGLDGIIVPRGDDAALTRAMARLAGDVAERRRMGAAGRARFEAGYELGAVADATVAMYRSLASGRP